MLSYRFCFYAIHTAPWVLGVGWLMNVLFFPRQSCGDTSPMDGVLIVLIGVYALVGGVLGVRLMRGSLALLCPFCSRPGRARLDRSEGLGMECPKCGEIRGGGRLGWEIVREKEEACGSKPAVPVSRMQFRSPWFWGLFGLSVVSAAAGVVIHDFSFITVFGPLWCFVVASHLVQALSTGCLNDNAGPTFRSRQPVRYWARTFIWLCGYAFAVYLPVGHALQERETMEEKAKTEVRAGGNP
ncbi:hypothetical protein [Prosthecobacter sp.]|uniref:hypothetical protein n=1 Tax=Prosthecobacter sp. TaxID=1965333 RepID=UPI003783162D